MTFEELAVPLAVLGVGLGVGTWRALSRRSSASEARAIESAGRREDLERQRDAAVDALRALELERHKLDPDDHARQRAELIEAGAGALRALDQETAPADPRVAALEAQRPVLGDAAVDAALAALRQGPAPERVSPAWQGAGLALLAVAVVAGFTWFARENAADRPPGAPMTGGFDPSPRSVDPEVAAFEARLGANPNDLEALNALTRHALGQEDLGTAMALNSRARTVDPTDKEARVYFAFLRMAIGQTDAALADLDGVLAEDPSHHLALVYKGLIALIADQPELAIEPLERALALRPDPFLSERLAAARARASGSPVPVPVPVPAGAGSLVVSGTATLDPSAAAALSGTEVLFVSVRDPAGGPPLAALRLPPRGFPLAFQVTTADAIAMGGVRPFPPVIDVSVRIDLDGDPMTRSDAEPVANLKGLTLGSSELTFELR